MLLGGCFLINDLNIGNFLVARASENLIENTIDFRTDDYDNNRNYLANIVVVYFIDIKRSKFTHESYK